MMFMVTLGALSRLGVFLILTIWHIQHSKFIEVHMTGMSSDCR